MIVFELECRAGGHRFEGWFGSSDDFSQQQERGLVKCPQCNSMEVSKAPMAPRLARKGNQVGQIGSPKVAGHDDAPAATPKGAIDAAAALPSGASALARMPPEAAAMMLALAKVQAEALKTSRWVGDNFAEDALAMHYGEKDHAPIHGQATVQQARDLVEEGIEIAPILFPLVAPDHIN